MFVNEINGLSCVFFERVSHLVKDLFVVNFYVDWLDGDERTDAVVESYYFGYLYHLKYYFNRSVFRSVLGRFNVLGRGRFAYI